MESLDHLWTCDICGTISDKKFLYDRNYVNSYLVMAVVKGCLIVEQYNKKYILKSNYGIIMDLKDRHKYYFEKNTDSEIIWFHFNGSMCEVIFNKKGNSANFPIIFNDNSIYPDIYKLLQLKKENKLGKEFDISCNIYNILIKAIKFNYLSTAKDDFKILISNYISNNIYTQITLDDMAKSMQINKYSFCKKFKENFNQTPFEYIKHEKINVAKALLRLTNHSLSYISELLNFYDQSCFSKTFKQIEGVTPLQYRNEATNI